MTVMYGTSLVYLALGIIILVLGFIILKENPRQRVNRITSVMMFFAGTGPIFGACGLLLQASSKVPMDLEPFRRVFLVWEFFFPQMLLFSFVFPQEIKWTKRHPYLVYLIFLPHLVHFLLILTFSSPEEIRSIIPLQALGDRFGLIIQPVTILLSLFLSVMSLVYRFHTNFFALVNLIYIILAIGLMVWGYRRLKSPRLRKQVGLVLWGIRASVGLYAIAFIFPHLNILHTSREAAYFLTFIALLIGAGSIAWAMIRYQFMDIRLIIRRGVIFSMASSVVVGVYLLVYSQGKRFITGFLGGSPILEIVFIILALLFFQPILSAIEKLIERIFMRDRLDYRNVLQDLSHDIMTTLDTAMLCEKITSTLREVMSLDQVELLVAHRDGTFSLHKGEKRIFFNPQDEWIRVLRNEKGPIGFDELSRRVGNEKGLGKLRALDAFLLIPLIHRESLSGILILGEKITKTSFTTEDMTILTVLSNQAAIALENARLYEDMLEKQRMEEELSFAREIQKRLLPHYFPCGERFELVGYNLPSREIGGDYYDFIVLNEHEIGIAIGDIAGKGIPAALLMSNLQAALRISANRTRNTREVIAQVNLHIAQTTSAERFATFFYGVFHTENLTLEYTNAGHNYPILWRSGAKPMLLQEGGMVIGVMRNAQYDTDRIRLQPGDFLVMYTDGITEALNSHEEEFGEHRLIQAAERAARQSAQGILDYILESVIDFTHGYLQSDDLTLVVLKVK